MKASIVRGALPPILGLLCAFPAAAAPRVAIDSGVLEGDDDGRVAAFRGIPYAGSPGGAWRWKPPRAVEPWPDVRPARELGPVCAQSERWTTTRRKLVTLLGGDPSAVPPMGAMSEDCLSLNVWTTNPGGSARQPVMVWLHGGAYAFGAGSDEAAALAAHGVVVVTLNYRLGIMGFMAHPALATESPHGSSGNYGLLDQIAALKWVKRNIAAFGGDADRVTVFGHSAGGASVLQLLASPLARGLFHRAISQSGGNGETRSRTAGEAQGLALAERVGAPAAGALAFLRAQPVERLVAAATGPYDPTVDGWVLPEALPGALGGGRGDDVPLILGATANEAVIFTMPRDLAGYRALLDAEDPSRRAAILARYPARDDDEARVAAIRLVTDRDFVCPARAVAARRRGRSFLYRVSAPPTPGPAGVALGAYHGVDLRLLFDLELGVPIGEAGRRVGDTMRRTWVRFAATGDPNGPGLPSWPAYSPARPRELELGRRIRLAVPRGCEAFADP